jgi:probable HAF family extracellular repeat protein
MQDLGTLSGATNATSYATGINNQGMVVGNATSYNGTLHAFLWKSPGAIQDLNWLIPPASGWELSTAEAINDKNEIVGTGLFGGSQRAYKLAPMAVQSVTVSPSPVVGGKQTYATVTLNGVAPGNVVVNLSSAHPAVTAPTSLIIPAGSNSGTALLTTSPVETAATGNIVATYNGVSQVGSVTVRPPVISSLTLTPTYVRGGGSITGTFLLDGPVAAKTLVTLASNKPVARPTESSLVLYPGEKSGDFTIDTHRVLTKITVTISATANGVTKTAQMVVLP